MMARRRKPTQKQLIRSILFFLIVLAAGIYILLEDMDAIPSITPSVSSSSTGGTGIGSSLEVHVIDVGNADSILILNEDKSMLIDAGENETVDTVIAYLKSHGVDSLDYAVATHPDADHIGGMDNVIKAIPIDTFIMSIMPEAITPTTANYLNMLKALEDKKIDVEEAVMGTKYTLGQADFTLLGPVGEFDSTNNMSVVIKLTFGDNRFLFMGDAETEAENALLSAGADLKADFIKIGHHGSKSSSQAKFLKAVGAKLAAIPCGADNRYGHPHKNVITNLQSQNITYYRSDIHGHIVVKSDGDSITVKTQK